MSDSQFLDELESLLFANDQDEFQDVYSARKPNKKRAKTISSVDIIPPLKRLTRGLPLGGTYNYAMLFSSALNTNSSLIMRQMLHEPLQPLTRFSKYLQKRSLDGGKTTDVMTFSAANQFYDYSDQFAHCARGSMLVKSISSYTHPTEGTTMICVNFTYEGVFMLPVHVQSSEARNVDSAETTNSSSLDVTSSETVYLHVRPSNIGVECEILSTDDSFPSSSLDASIASDCEILSTSDISDQSGEESDGSEAVLPIPAATTSSIAKEEEAAACISEHPFSAKGSYVLYLNEENKIHVVEFFFSFLS